MRSKQQVNKKRENVYLHYVLKYLDQGLCPAQVAQKIGTSKQNLNRYIQKCKNKGFIKKIGYGVWEVSRQGKQEVNKEVNTSALGTLQFLKERTNLHALNITIPVLKGVVNLEGDGGYKQLPLDGWTPEYKKLSGILQGVTFKNNNNKSVSVQLWGRDIEKLNEVYGLVFKGLAYATSYFKEKGVVLDPFNARVSSIHISTRAEDLDRVLNKGEKIEVLLNRKAERILPGDREREAKAWMDSSPYNGVETDDLEYKRNYLMMPERIAYMEQWTSNIHEYNQNIKLHLDVLREIKDAIKVLKGEK